MPCEYKPPNQPMKGWYEVLNKVGTLLTMNPPTKLSGGEMLNLFPGGVYSLSTSTLKIFGGFLPPTFSPSPKYVIRIKFPTLIPVIL